MTGLGMRKNKILSIVILLFLFLGCLYLSVFAGHDGFGVDLFLKSFQLNDRSEDAVILELIRYPRAIKAIVAGVCLALAGLFLQTVSKNPLAEPYITGISSGAGLGIVLSVLFFNSANYSFFGFLGAMVSSLLVISFAGFRKFSITKLILVGLSINIFVSALISMIILMNSEKSYSMLYILSGNLTENNLVSDKHLLLIFFVILLFSAFLIPKLNFLRLDEGMVFSSVKHKNMYSIFFIICSALLTSLSVLAAGILGFIGIIAPLISKMIVGQDFRYLFFVNIFLGASLILFADFLSRTLIYPMQIPLGLVVAFIGAPVFVFFLTKKGDILND